MEKKIATTIPEWKDLMAEEGRKTNANVTITFELEEGGQFILKYRLSKKGGKNEARRNTGCAGYPGTS